MFLLSSGKLRSSRQAGRHHFQIEYGLKSISAAVTRPHGQYHLLWGINRKLYRSKKAAFSHGSESAAVISAGFIICFFGLGIEVEKCYQMYLLNFKSSVIAKEIGAYPLLLSIYKNVEFRIFCQKTDHGCVFICFLFFFFVFFSQGWSYLQSGPRMSRESSF